MSKEEILDKLTKAVIDGDEETASKIAQETLTTGVEPMEAIHQASKGLELLGEKFERSEVYLPELILGGDAMKVCMDILLPHITPEQKDEASLGKVVIGTVSGDIHDVGKKLGGRHALGSGV